MFIFVVEHTSFPSIADRLAVLDNILLNVVLSLPNPFCIAYFQRNGLYLLIHYNDYVLI